MSRPAILMGAAVVLAGVIFSLNLGGYDLWPPDEPRYALIAREMIESGDYMVPRVNNQPYKEKPPLLFWLIAAASSVTGEVTPLSARIPSAAAGIITLIFTGLLARELFNARIALWSVLILMTMQRFWWNARFGQIDMLLTACLTMGLYGFWRWEVSRRYGWLMLFYAGVLAGLYSKGPGVLVFPVLFVLAWSWRSERRREAWLYLAIGCGFCVLAYAAWMVPAHILFAEEVQASAGDTLASNLFRQTLGRFFLGVSHANWPWYYLTTLPVDWLPWTLFLPWVAIWTWRHRHDGAPMRFLLSWTVPAFVFFCIAIGKRGVYLLPLFPAFAMFFASAVLGFMESDNLKWQKRMAAAYALLLLCIGLAPMALPFTRYRELWTPTLAVFALIITAYGVLFLYHSRKGATSYLHLHVTGSFVLLSVFCSLVIFPAVNLYKSARPFCRPVAEIADAGLDFDLYSVGFAREEYVFYSRHFLKELYTEAVPLEHSHDMGMMEMMRLQKDLSRAITKSVEEVEIDDVTAITPDELEQLRKSLAETVGKKGYPPELVEDFKNGLKKVSDEFFTVFGSTRPAFLYVQDSDWRWIYALHPDLQGAVVLDKSSVGSRNVLLVANPAGASLIPRAG